MLEAFDIKEDNHQRDVVVVVIARHQALLEAHDMRLKHGSSIAGHEVVDRETTIWHNNLMKDYFILALLLELLNFVSNFE